MSDSTPKPWGGRFVERTDVFVERFTASVFFDQRLAKYDIEGSKAHAYMLQECNILSKKEYLSIVDGLVQIEQEIESGTFEWSVELEDVHMNIEARLVQLIGDTGKKLHTGRSRNDQVSADLRLWLRAETDELIDEIDNLLVLLLEKAESAAETIMPGLTHLQNAQPVTFGHHLLAWFEMLMRDRERICDCRKRMNRSPLGAAALAGTSYPINPEITAVRLGFESVCHNSLDAVSDRDFVIEFAATSSLIAIHLSRWCEEIIFWNSTAVGMISLPDAFATGSSIMPQKKNPDVPELIRGKTGRVIGNLTSLLVLMKAQSLAYNKDNQEDKEPLFDTVDTLRDCLKALALLIPQLTPNEARMRELAESGHPTATDFADWLVNKGIPFRDAHDIVGRIVGLAEERACRLQDLSLDEMREVSDTIDESVYEVLQLDASVAARSHLGGTAPQTVHKAIEAAQQRLIAAQEVTR